jgi:hypothetical protein
MAGTVTFVSDVRDNEDHVRLQTNRECLKITAFIDDNHYNPA